MKTYKEALNWLKEYHTNTIIDCLDIWYILNNNIIKSNVCDQYHEGGDIMTEQEFEKMFEKKGNTLDYETW